MAEPHPDVVDPLHPLVQRVREFCMDYPDAIEQRAWGRPTFRAGKKIFIVVGASMDDPLTIIFKPDADERLAYLSRAQFFAPAYWGPSGWLAAPLDTGDPDWEELTEIIDASYRQVALVRQIKAIDTKHPKPLV